MDSETTLLVLSNRSFLYSLLARGFAEEPDEGFFGILQQDHTARELGLVADEATGAIVAAHQQVLAALKDGDALARARHAYVTIFVGPGTPKAYPWESVHLSDTKALFQAELLPIRDAYREAGFLPKRYPHVQDDFIGLELDFLAKLAQAALQDWQAGRHDDAQVRLDQSLRFLNEHLLRWIDSLASAIQTGYGDGFYSRFTQLAALVAHRDQRILS